MTIDEAIKHCLERAEENDNCADKCEAVYGEDNGIIEACRECAAEHRQLAEWLRELKEAKRLLKLAVEDFKERDVVISHHCVLCKYADDPVDICQSRPRECFEWVHTEEAEKLIGGSEK